MRSSSFSNPTSFLLKVGIRGQKGVTKEQGLTNALWCMLHWVTSTVTSSFFQLHQRHGRSQISSPGCSPAVCREQIFYLMIYPRYGTHAGRQKTSTSCPPALSWINWGCISTGGWDMKKNIYIPNVLHLAQLWKGSAQLGNLPPQSYRESCLIMALCWSSQWWHFQCFMYLVFNQHWNRN